MKKFIILMFFASLISITSAQPCLPDGIIFDRQTQIDSFQINYPICSEILGDVKIRGGNITNLNGLYVLTHISGSLTIVENGNLISLAGLDNLISVGGDLLIQVNIDLTSLTGLDNLTLIGGSLVFTSNSDLTDLNGLGNLTSIGGDLLIKDNLISLIGLDNLLTISGSLIIKFSESLINLTGLENVDSIGGNLVINYNHSLTSLAGLHAATQGNLQITENSLLCMCAVPGICDYLANPKGVIDIYNNAEGCNNPPEVADVCGISLECLPFGNYRFLNQVEIDSFPYNYANCNQLNGDTYISGNGISNLNGFNNLTFIEGKIEVRSTNITNLSGLDNIDSIKGDLFLSNNPLSSLINLEDLTFIGGELRIGNCDSLNNLIGLDNVTSVKSTFN